MKQKENKKLAREWFKIGDEELKFAQASFNEFGTFYPQICFQCQQAVEKYLKGFLKFSKSAAILSQYYIRSRYLVEYLSATKGEAER